MAKVYINLHPTYTYSNVIISDGYIDELKEYVSLVDWLTWDWHSIKGKPIIHVMGGFNNDEKAIEKHLERTWVFLQRIVNTGQHDIFIRDSRSDEWAPYEPIREYTKQEMHEIEIQRVRELDNERFKADIEKYRRMIGYGQDELIKEMIDEKVAELTRLEEEEILRQERLKGVWIN